MAMSVPKPTHVRRIPRRAKRNDFSKKVREQIIERDEGECRNCGSPGSQIHHVKYRSQGGRGVFTNGLLVCNSCHEKIHRNVELKESWQQTFETIYGPSYWKDEWDETDGDL